MESPRLEGREEETCLFLGRRLVSERESSVNITVNPNVR